MRLFGPSCRVLSECCCRGGVAYQVHNPGLFPTRTTSYQDHKLLVNQLIRINTSAVGNRPGGGEIVRVYQDTVRVIQQMVVMAMAMDPN